MPTYEYRCEKCLNEFEQFQRITDPPVKRCPRCRGKVRRLVSGGCGLIFKGSGFYLTDYVRKSEKSDAKETETRSEAKSASEAEKKTKTA